jgi:NAD(P)-dependent dehydrogenase (short-subunit alcohol dehydrogenase family)
MPNSSPARGRGSWPLIFVTLSKPSLRFMNLAVMLWPVKSIFADSKSTSEMADLAVSVFGKIDGLVNNAAAYSDLTGGRFETLDEQE